MPVFPRFLFAIPESYNMSPGWCSRPTKATKKVANSLLRNGKHQLGTKT